MGTINATSRFLTPEQVALILQVHRRTLSNWRSAGRGPRYVHMGRRVRYRMADVDAWTVANTFDPDGNGRA